MKFWHRRGARDLGGSDAPRRSPLSHTLACGSRTEPLAEQRPAYETTAKVALAGSFVAFLAFSSGLLAQERQPSGPAAQAAPASRGAEVYQSCAACHGSNIRGGAGGGVSLATSAIAQADDGGKTLHSFLKVGRPDKGMPPFPSYSEADVAALSSFLRSQAGTGKVASADDATAAMLVGNPVAGESFFKGSGGCAACHSVTGDLKGIASRYDVRTLQTRMVLTRTRTFSRDEPEGKTVTVTLPNGETARGTLKRISDFKVVLREDSGNERTIARAPNVKVEVKDKLQAHLDLIQRYTDVQIHDLTAYLATLK